MHRHGRRRDSLIIKSEPGSGAAFLFVENSVHNAGVGAH